MVIKMNIKYIAKRIKDMNYGNLLKKVEFVSRKTKKPKIIILFDMIYCGFVYQAGYMDYDLFEMYNLNRKQRKTVLTRGINNKYIKEFNNPSFNHFFSNKNEFNEKFNPYLKREWLILDGKNEQAFEHMIKNKEFIIVKPLSGSCGKGIEKLKVLDYKPNELYQYLMDSTLLLVEEVIVQNEELNHLNPSSINTIRMITISKNKKAGIIAAYLRIGNGRVVDNFNSGGMVVPINIDTGIIEYPALDKAGNLYTEHPTSNVTIKGFKIPMWEEAKALAKEVTQVIPEVGLVGWDISISDKGPLLVEGNEYPGHDIYQLPPHRTNGIGMVPEFDRALKEIGMK